MQEKFEEYVRQSLLLDYGKNPHTASGEELYSACAKAVNAVCAQLKAEQKKAKKRACYFSAEFLIGRLMKSNLYNLGILESAQSFLSSCGRSLDELEAVSDAALGNGGLGRLAACFLDSAASLGYPLDGYGIRYRYGLFKQKLVNNAQTQLPDDWLSGGDAFSVRRADEAVRVDFADLSVLAVPYDYYVIGKGGVINNLRLFQAEKFEQFDLESFDKHDYDTAFDDARVRAISAVLYPSDSTDEGKQLRIMQQYFFCSAALQNILRKLDNEGVQPDEYPEHIVIQLNDTHPTVAVPELMRLLILRGKTFPQAFNICTKVFAYTNHTVMAEALEKWSFELYKKILPEIALLITQIDDRLCADMAGQNRDAEELRIIRDGKINMANLAIYCSFSVNGVAKIHTGILKNNLFKTWNSIYPNRFSNKTNGITQRRWLALSNPELTKLIESRIGEFIDIPQRLSELEKFADDAAFLDELIKVKQSNKLRLARYIASVEGVEIDPDSVFCVQVKRVHEYKRQLMNALSICDVYLALKNGEISNLPKVTFIFGGKAAPSYALAKGIIRYINALAEKINTDKEINGLIKVVFVQDYNVSYAEKIIPAAEISEQLSLAGTEASGTGNMKFMMNGALTLGTYDGANIEIVERAGEENNFIFGLRENEVTQLKESYNPKEIYLSDARIKRAVDTLIDGTLSDGASGDFRAIYNSLLKSADGCTADAYFVLRDMEDYTQTRLRAIKLCADKMEFAKKSLMNIAASGCFSSDRTVEEYARQIWFGEDL